MKGILTAITLPRARHRARHCARRLWSLPLLPRCSLPFQRPHGNCPVAKPAKHGPWVSCLVGNAWYALSMPCWTAWKQCQMRLIGCASVLSHSHVGLDQLFTCRKCLVFVAMLIKQNIEPSPKVLLSPCGFRALVGNYGRKICKHQMLQWGQKRVMKVLRHDLQYTPTNPIYRHWTLDCCWMKGPWRGSICPFRPPMQTSSIMITSKCTGARRKL